jgi:hypothetical protein
MKLAATHLAQTWAREDVASWENEGGAIKSAPKVDRIPIATVGWPPASIVDPTPTALRGADKGMTDTHSLAVLQVSLLLLVPVMAGIAMFWASVAVSAPR